MKSLYLMAICIVALVGCQNLQNHGGVYGLNGVYPGSRLIVNQELKADHGARVYIQGGKVRDYRDVFQQTPYCQFYATRSSIELHQELVVRPDEFLVERVYRRRLQVDSGEIKLASAGLQLAGLNDYDAGNSASQYTMALYMDINSPTQPQITHLICSVWAVPYERNYVSASEIRQTMGDLTILVE